MCSFIAMLNLSHWPPYTFDFFQGPFVYDFPETNLFLGFFILFKNFLPFTFFVNEFIFLPYFEVLLKFMLKQKSLWLCKIKTFLTYFQPDIYTLVQQFFNKIRPEVVDSICQLQSFVSADLPCVDYKMQILSANFIDLLPQLFKKIQPKDLKMQILSANLTYEWTPLFWC